LENTVLISEFLVFGEDFDHLGDSTLKTREAMLQVLEDLEFYKAHPLLKKEHIRKAGICLYEAEANITIHAKFGIVKTFVNKQKIKSIAKDIGPGIPNLLLAMTPGFSTASEKARILGFGAGMGLKNIQKISDLFVITSQYGKGTYLLFEIWQEEHLEKEVLKMKIKNLIEELELKVLTSTSEETFEKIIKDAYACDLLSYVLAKGKEESAWITVQTNINIVGVAVIKRIPIIIISEGGNVPEETIRKAEENSIIIAKTSKPTFEISGKLYSILKGS
jgi:anti-sigma regulatory factor (Ser/Thr protein kinase)